MARRHRADAPRDLRHQPGHARADGDGVAAGHARRDQRRPDGPRHRPRRLRPARPRQAADHDGRHRGGRSGSSGRSSPARRSNTRAPSSSFPWTQGWTLPVWVAGYGPMALAMTGRIADGLILQLADPDLIRWFVGQVREAAAAAGRDPASIQVQAAAPAYVGDRANSAASGPAGSRRSCRNHVVDLVNKYPREQLPEALTGYVRDRSGYDYHHHAEVGSSNASFVGDEVTDRFCILGSRRGPRRQAARAGRGRRRPVQPVPDERRRGGPARAPTAATSSRPSRRWMRAA